jgi:hypothetical protein
MKGSSYDDYQFDIHTSFVDLSLSFLSHQSVLVPFLALPTLKKIIVSSRGFSHDHPMV